MTDPTKIHHLVRENILKLKPYSSARSEFKGRAQVYLDANENPNETGLNRYPDPLQWRLKAAIGDLRAVSVDNIFLGNGSDEVIDLLIRIFCRPGVDHIVVLPPSYGMYRVSADINDVAVKEIPLREDFQLEVDRILTEANERSKILFLCSPNNPSGNRLHRLDIRRLIDGFPGIVVVDEAYIDFSVDESIVPWIFQHPKLVVAQTFSKAWGMAGIRLGLAFADEPVIELLNKVKPPYNINQLTQNKALEAMGQLQQTGEWVQTILRERAQLAEALAGYSTVEKIHPSDANFLLVKVSEPNELYRYLVSKGIIVRNRSTMYRCEGCLRFTVGTPEENRRLLAEIKNYENINQNV